MGNISVKPHHRSRNKKQVRWKAADRPSPPGKPQFVPESFSLPGVITLSWTPPKHDGGSSIAGYLVEHRKCGSTHWLKSTPLLVPLPEVSLSGFDPGWRYQFRVSAENAVGISMPSDISEPLTVTLQRSTVLAPRFTEELKDTVALENEKVEFVVHFMAQPPPKVSWYKDGFEIFSSRRTRIFTDSDKSILTIHQTSLSDEGEIKCTVTNRVGHASTRALLKLEASPTIRLPRQYEEGLLFEIGEVIRLKVSVAGRPTPLVFWFHNGESIRNDDRREIDTTDLSSTLKISESLRSDRGEYQIKAVNKLGEDIKSFLVTITDKPSPPGRARVVMTLGRSVTLSWKSPQDDGGCKIGNYIVEYNRLGWDVWLKAATCRQLTTVLGDLIEGSEYRFRVKAESPFGISDPSEESEPVFIPDSNRGIHDSRSRAKSQPPDLVPSDYISISYEPKTEVQPRSRSSSRTEKHVTISEITDIIPPQRPKRTKSKSAPQTPLPSPAVTRRKTNTAGIDKNMFDRASMARELAYGSPGMKTKWSEEEYNNNVININETNRNEETKYNNKQNVSEAMKTRPIPTSIQKETSHNKSPSPIRAEFNVEKQFNDRYSPVKSKEEHSVSHNPKKTETYEDLDPKRRTNNNSVVKQTLNSKNERNPTDYVNKTRKDLSTEEILHKSTSIHSQNSTERRKSEQMVNSANQLSNKETLPKAPNSLREFSKSPSPNRFERQRSPNKLDFMGSSKDRDDTNSGSTEFMLVLFPDEKDGGHGNYSEMVFNFDDVSVPPPLSLSAPELGAEPPRFEFIRSASSTDILRELQMQRMFEAVSVREEQQQKRKEKVKELDENLKIDIPKIQINSKDAECSPTEKVPPFKRKFSGSFITKLHPEFAQRRGSLKTTPILDEIPENKIHRINFSLQDKREEFKKREMKSIEEIIQERQQEKEISKKEIAVAGENDWDEESVEGSEDQFTQSESNPSDEELFIESNVPVRNQDEDEPIYHPGLMVRKNVLDKDDKQPFEILTKPCPLPNPSFVPKPILKKREKSKWIPDKPIRKDLETKLQHISESVYLGGNHTEHRPRSSSPRPPAKSNFEKKSHLPFETIPTIQENKLEINSSPEIKNPGKSNDEIKAVTDHYGDILKSYSQNKKQTPHLYLDRDELKAAAEEQSHENLDEIDKSVERLHIPDRSEFEGFEGELELEKKVRSRTVSASSDDNDKNLSQRRGSGSSFGSLRQRRNSNSKTSTGSRSKSRSLSKSPAHEENWSNLRSPPSPQMGRKSSPSPQRRNSLQNTQISNKRLQQQRKNLREITTQTSGFDDNYLPYQRVPTPEQEQLIAQVEHKVRTTIDYWTDLAMFVLACWLYLFQNELYAVPVLLVMVYRQLQEEIKKRLPKWIFSKKKRKERRF